jgi:hypothetical protein
MPSRLRASLTLFEHCRRGQVELIAEQGTFMSVPGHEALPRDGRAAADVEDSVGKLEASLSRGRVAFRDGGATDATREGWGLGSSTWLDSDTRVRESEGGTTGLSLVLIVPKGVSERVQVMKR